MDPTFEADPIRRRVECRPTKGNELIVVINIKFPLGPPGVVKFPLGGPGGKNYPWGPMGPRVKNSTFHEFLIQGGLGCVEHPPARYKV